MILFLQFAVRVSLHAKCALTSGSEMPTPVWNAEETTQGKTPTESQELMVHCLLLVILSKIKYSGKEKLYTCYKCHTLRSFIIWHYYSSSLLVTGVCYTLRVNILLNIQYKKSYCSSYYCSVIDLKVRSTTGSTFSALIRVIIYIIYNVSYIPNITV